MNLKELKSLYDKGINIIEHLQNQGMTRSEAIAISYDLQAGSYITFAQANDDYIEKYTTEIATIINDLDVEVGSIMEVGVGEATTLTHVHSQLENAPEAFGFDISLSRILYARRYFNQHNAKGVNLFVGDLFHTPIADNAIDIVYTSHSIEPNGGREEQALLELFRITNKYLVLFEPSYEYATDEGKERMDRLGYVKDLAKTAERLGMNVMLHRLTTICSNPLNPTAVVLIEKDPTAITKWDVELCCPETKVPLQTSNGCYWSESSLKTYPIVQDIPCLTREHGIIATHYEKFATSPRLLTTKLQ